MLLMYPEYQYRMQVKMTGIHSRKAQIFVWVGDGENTNDLLY